MITKEQIIEWFCKRNKIKKEELDKYHRYAIATALKYAQEQGECNRQSESTEKFSVSHGVGGCFDKEPKNAYDLNIIAGDYRKVKLKRK